MPGVALVLEQFQHGGRDITRARVSGQFEIPLGRGGLVCLFHRSFLYTNRKSLAYTSKRPGKTQQFNFFAVNDKPEREREIKYGDVIPGEKDLDSFYIVDLPGFGFAKVPQKQRDEWSEFFTEYLAKRRNLRVLFHLVDARHGPIDEDENIMKQVGETLPKDVRYVVILTKADKNVKAHLPFLKRNSAHLKENNWSNVT